MERNRSILKVPAKTFAGESRLILFVAPRRTSFASTLPCLVLLAASLLPQTVFADGADCGSLSNRYGPFDYRTSPAQVKLVEDYHFNDDVETLRKGITGYVGGELDYTLRAIPNHPRALVAMMHLQFKEKTTHPRGATLSVPCYFDRAVRFQPDDPTVHIIFGVYLMRLGKPAEAIREFEAAVSLGDDSGNLYYNLGLAYFEVGDYEKSVGNAKKAYDLGFNLPGLKEKLSKAGKWPPPQ